MEAKAELGAGYTAEGYISMALIWHMKAGAEDFVQPTGNTYMV